MNKKALVIVSVTIGLFLIGGGVFAYGTNQNNKKEQEKTATEKKTEDSAMMKENTAVTNKDNVAKESDVADNTASKQGSYVTLADYNKDPSKYVNSTKVYFFHASWCPICRDIDKEINDEPDKIPSGLTMIKTDFDSSTELRRKYGVTTQYTFVQVDNDGSKIAQWSAASFAKAISGIESQG